MWVLIIMILGSFDYSGFAVNSVNFATKDSCEKALIKVLDKGCVKGTFKDQCKYSGNNFKIKAFCVENK